MMRIHRVCAASALVLLSVAVGACNNRGDGAGGAAPEPAKMPSTFGIGTPATEAQIATLNLDINPSGVGLPPGSGTAAQGAVVYAAKCASCHGVHGEGIAKYPKLIGREPRDGFPFGTDVKLVKTVGNYWSHSTTVYDYVRRAMPLTAPGSLTPPEVYGLVAYLLAENEIIARDAVMDATSLPAVKMPANAHFVSDSRKAGAAFR